ncbi:Gfo/Idh/MocA family protein [Fusobacterium hwasookii]
MNIALIGYGYWGKIVSNYIKNHEYFKLKKIYDTQKRDEEIFTDDINEIMKNDNIKAIYIASPVSTHFNLIKTGIENGKYIFCEKVLVNDKEELEYIKKNYVDKIIETNYIYTDSNSINYIRSIIGEIGEIKYIEGELKQFGNFYTDSDVYSTIGCHLLSSIMYIFNTNDIQVSFDNIITNNRMTVKGSIRGTLNKKIPFLFNVDLLYNEKTRNIILYGTDGILYFNPINENYTIKLIKLDLINNEIIEEKKFYFNEKDNINLSLKRFEEVLERKRKPNIDMSIKISEILINE